MIYLQDKPVIKEPLNPEQIKNRLLGHWGVSSVLVFIYIHMMRLIKKYGLDMIFLAGPAWRPHACIWREAILRFIRKRPKTKTACENFSNNSRFRVGMRSHCIPETPGSIHEGGELGYVLSHACGAVFDDPELIAVAVVGDGESEQGTIGYLLARTYEKACLANFRHAESVALLLFTVLKSSFQF